MSVTVISKKLATVKAGASEKAAGKHKKALPKRAGEGYKRSRLNSIQHGLSANITVLPGENPKEFERLRQELHDEWEPRGPTEESHVDVLVHIVWKQRRFVRVEQAYHRQAVLRKFADCVDPIGDDAVNLNVAKLIQDPLIHKEPEIVFEQIFGGHLWDASPSKLTELKGSLSALLKQKSVTSTALQKAVSKLPMALQLLWELALERPSSFHQFVDLHGLTTAKVFACDWSDFSKWISGFALPYVELFEGTHPVSRDYRNHLVQLANFEAMEKLAGLSRYDAQLWNKRKEVLAILVKLREIDLVSSD